MKRGGPIRRKSPMKRKLARRLTRPGPGRDETYLEWVRLQPCILMQFVQCFGRTHAHHAGPKRMDRTAIPLCQRHHDDWHSAAGNGYFGGWDKERRRVFAECAIAETKFAYGPF